VIDTALTHLIESKAGIEHARDDHLHVIQETANTSVLGLQHRSEVEDVCERLQTSEACVAGPAGTRGGARR
jgi:hypothetical protein